VGGGVAAAGGEGGRVGGREVGVVASEEIGVGVAHGGGSWAGRAGVELKIEKKRCGWEGEEELL